MNLLSFGFSFGDLMITAGIKPPRSYVGSLRVMNNT